MLVLGSRPGSRGPKVGSNLLVKRVGAGAPVREEDGEADGLEELGDDVQADRLEWPLLGDELSEELLSLVSSLAAFGVSSRGQ
jgi:hypothetical protein